MRYRLLFLVSVVFFALTACNKPEPVEPPTSLSVNTKSLTFNQIGGVSSIIITANKAWTASVSGTGFSIDPTQGEGCGTITVKAEVNSSIEEIKGSVTIKSGEITKTVDLSQEGRPEEPTWIDTRYFSQIAKDNKVKEIYFNVNTIDASAQKLHRDYERGPEVYYSVSGDGVLNLYTLATSFQPVSFFGFYTPNSLDNPFETLEILDLTNVDLSKLNYCGYLFSGCTHLKSITFGKEKLQPSEILDGMFRDCASLESIDLSFLDTSKATDMKGFFEGCSSLKKVDLSGCDTRNVQDMSYMFSGCESLESINLSNFKTQKALTMAYMFAECRSLKSIDLKSFDTSKVIQTAGMFFDCRSLGTLDLTNFNTSSLLSAGNMFNSCVSLTSLDLSSFKLRDECDFFNSMIEVGSEVSKCVIRCSYHTCMKFFSKTVSMGLVEIELTDKDGLYESTSYARDGQVVQLQKATKGNGIDVVFMCDGFSDRMIEDGKYDKHVQACVNGLFSEEPFKSYKDYFNIYEVYAVSKNELYFFDTAFDVVPIVGPTGSNCEYFNLSGNTEKAKEYAAKAFESGHSLDNVAICVFSNVLPALNYGTTYYSNFVEGDYGIGASVSLVSSDMNPKYANICHIVLHELGGHGFAKLGDEFYYVFKEMSTVPQGVVDLYTNKYNTYGAYKNIDFIGESSKVKWSKFINDSRYNAEAIGVNRGGLEIYNNGVWHPTEGSVMSMEKGASNKFNAPSREAIYYRINKLAYGENWQYDYETFVKFDLKL